MQWLSTSCMVCLSSETRTYDVRVGNRGKDRQGKKKHIFVSGEWHREHSALSSLIDLSLVEGGGCHFRRSRKLEDWLSTGVLPDLVWGEGRGKHDLFYDGSLKVRRVLAARPGAALGYSCRLSGHLTRSIPAPPPTFLLPLPLQKKLMAKTTKSNILSFSLCWNREELAGQPLQDTWVMRLCTVSNRQPHKINTKRNDKKMSTLIGLCSLLTSTNLYTQLQIAIV
jgi:hypothetical protein